MLERLRGEVTGKLSHVQLMTPEQQAEMMRQMQEVQAAQQNRAAGIPEEEDAIIASRPNAAPAAAGTAAAAAPAAASGPGAGVNPDDPSTWAKVGRNGPCPCGSGKKYKQCHGKIA